jgi:hypothetical protein
MLGIPALYPGILRGALLVVSSISVNDLANQFMSNHIC